MGELDVVGLWPNRAVAVSVLLRSNQYPGLSLLGALRCTASRCKN